MTSWIADFFQSGHPLEEIYEMSYFDYVELVNSLAENRSQKSGKNTPRKLRPVQKEAIKRAKELELKK